jgi:hypothetical protein
MARTAGDERTTLAVGTGAGATVDGQLLQHRDA